MIPPTSIDGTDITGATIDGTDVTEITVDGDVVFSAGPAPGTHFYYIPQNTQNIIEHYILSTPFDISNLGSPTNTLNTGFGGSGTLGMALSNDGTIFYAHELTAVKKYNLSTPFDLSSAGSGTNFTVGDGSAFQFADEGNKFYINDGNGVLEQYELSTAYDVTTRTGPTATLGGFPSFGPGDPAFSPDGTQVVIGEISGSTITGGTCSTPFNIGTFNQTNTFTTNLADPVCCKWNGDGTTLFVRHASPNDVEEYSTPNPYSLNGLTFVQQLFVDAFATGGIDFNYNF